MQSIRTALSRNKTKKSQQYLKMVKKHFFQSVTTQWSSIPHGKKYGTRKIVTIKNGKGYQINENLNMTGEAFHRRKRTLKGNRMRGTRRRN